VWVLLVCDDVDRHLVLFIGLNAVRALSLVALILVFSSTILVIVNNVKAVNAFDGHKNSTDHASMLDCDYIEYAAHSHSWLSCSTYPVVQG